jgi:hypothetical protein
MIGGHRPQSFIPSEYHGIPRRIVVCDDHRFRSAGGIPFAPGQDRNNNGHAAVASPFRPHCRHPRPPALDPPSSSSSISVHQLLDGCASSHPALDDVVVVVVVVVIVLGVVPNAVNVVVAIVDAHASDAARSRSANATNVARRGGGGFWGRNDNDDEAAGRKEERRRRRMRRMLRRLPSSRRVATTPLGDAEAVDATITTIVAARHDDAAGRHRRCIILGRDVAILLPML